ncbi:RAD50-interacting protein 1 [Melipona quadrifasciata]|uniref:RAD50-interacting protein 1 n=1 Tax=Melipona quadrifasciata TaxID=166423 RepID=A0A0M8ZQQ4_9HYME|nr:RAD50-interacting protein 1 [Melipona quadrifasciata]
MIDTKKTIIQKFNTELGSDLKGLNKIYEFHQSLNAQKSKIEESLSMASTEAPSKVKAVVESVEQISIEFQQLEKSSSEFKSDIEETMQKNDKSLQEMQNIIDVISYLDKSLSYLNFIKYVENISDEIQVSLTNGNDESTISLYVDLTNISCQLRPSTCHYLQNYVKETLHFWHNLIKDKLSKEYNDILKTLKWPFCGSNANILHTPMPETLTKFKILTEYLLHLQLPEESAKYVVTSVLLTDFTPVSLPISLLVRPLRQRFIYHFTGSKLTNRQDKPEWFFTQILTWIKDHVQWVQKNVQPAANSIGFDHIDMKVEFMRTLIQLAVEKLHSELSVVQYDDALFAHLVDEALGFERELRETLFYPSTQPATVFVLTQAHIFVKWINMEKKLIYYIMFICILLKIVTILESYLPIIKIDKLLINNYLFNDHFLQLYFFKQQFEAAETATLKGNDITKNVGEVEGSVFDEAVALLRRLEKKLINEISDSVALDVKAKSRPYRTDKWFAMQSTKEVVSLSVTPSGYSMFQELATQLNLLHNTLALLLFQQAWKNLASQFDQFLLEEVVLVNHFNTGGAEQLQYDIFRNLFPLFGLYISKPESYFPLIKEACILLNIMLGSAMLLAEALHNEDEVATSKILADVGIYKMSSDLALKVIGTRTDMTYV